MDVPQPAALLEHQQRRGRGDPHRRGDGPHRPRSVRARHDRGQLDVHHAEPARAERPQPDRRRPRQRPRCSSTPSSTTKRYRAPCAPPPDAPEADAIPLPDGFLRRTLTIYRDSPPIHHEISQRETPWDTSGPGPMSPRPTPTPAGAPATGARPGTRVRSPRPRRSAVVAPGHPRLHRRSAPATGQPRTEGPSGRRAHGDHRRPAPRPRRRRTGQRLPGHPGDRRPQQRRVATHPRVGLPHDPAARRRGARRDRRRARPPHPAPDR